jgi:putative NADH-flavin reductase
MRKVLIIGASKGIGLETVKRALKAGHSVRAVSRSATAIRLRDPKLEKLDGDALSRDTVEHALVGVDAVIQTLGVQPPT